MKIVLIVLGVLLQLVMGVVVIGAVLPKRHVAARSATFKASPEKLFALIVGNQDWLPDVKSCELITADGGKQFQRETSKHGQRVLYELQGSRPPLAIQRRIATENLPWTYGSAASIIVVLLWLYYSAYMFLLGAEFTHVYAREVGSLRKRTSR